MCPNRTDHHHTIWRPIGWSLAGVWLLKNNTTRRAPHTHVYCCCEVMSIVLLHPAIGTRVYLWRWFGCCYCWCCSKSSSSHLSRTSVVSGALAAAQLAVGTLGVQLETGGHCQGEPHAATRTRVVWRSGVSFFSFLSVHLQWYM